MADDVPTPTRVPAQVTFPVGFHRFTRDWFMNYQLNRWHALGLARREDLEQAGAKIRSFGDCVRELEVLGAAAAADGRFGNAMSYYRAAEFLEPPGSVHKHELYAGMVRHYDAAFVGEGVERRQVAYAGAHLSTIRFAPRGEPRGETLLGMGGFDSFIEDFHGFWAWFAGQGYEVIAFEGPGQGATHRTHGLLFDHHYEKPTAAVLDAYGLESAALLGISMGGWWAARAAAFEPRITRLILDPPLYDWLEQTNFLLRWWVKKMTRWRWFTNFVSRMKAYFVPAIRHALRHINYIAPGDEPYDAIRWMLSMNKENLPAERIQADVLLLCGAHDAWQPPKLLNKQAAALVNARSVSTRIFTKAEHADQHCQMGNIQLSLDVMTRWLATGSV